MEEAEQKLKIAAAERLERERIWKIEQYKKLKYQQLLESYKFSCPICS
jgi:hypothetical protein